MAYLWYGRAEDDSPLLMDKPSLVYQGIMTTHDLPAWSLHRLIEMMPCDVEISGIWIYANRSYEFKEKNNVYDNLIDLLTSIIKEGYFNKEYLV